MKTNMGSADRVIRTLVAIIIVVLYYTGVFSGTISIVLLVLAGIFMVTSIIGVCPLYMPLGLSTVKRKIPGRR